MFRYRGQSCPSCDKERNIQVSGHQWTLLVPESCPNKKKCEDELFDLIKIRPEPTPTIRTREH